MTRIEQQTRQRHFKGIFCIVLYAIFFCVPVNLLSAQAFDLGSWNIVNIKYNLDEKWSFFGEAELRSLKFYSNFHYYEYKGGINYKVYKDVNLTLGAGSYQTYKEGGDFVLPKNRSEIRLWPQIQVTQQINTFKIENRFRTEFRFSPSGYRNRFRNRIGVIYPLLKNKEGKNLIAIGAYNELFFTNLAPYFERNRASFNLNFKVAKHSTILLGYLIQFDYKINDETGKNFLQIGYYHEFLRKKK